MTSRIVVVDDHAGFRSWAREFIEDLSHTVVGEAESALEALDVIEGSAPDLVLLDIQLPDASGFELLHMLRRRGSGVKVLLTSSRSAASYRKQLADADAVAFVSKDGLTPELLEQTLGAI